MKNDPHTEYKAIAQKIANKYKKILNDLRIRSTSGDKEAVLQLIEELANYHGSLKAIGYRTTTEDELGKVGRVVARTPEWAAERLTEETKSDKIVRELRNENLTPEERKTLMSAFFLAIEEESKDGELG